MIGLIMGTIQLATPPAVTRGGAAPSRPNTVCHCNEKSGWVFLSKRCCAWDRTAALREHQDFRQPRAPVS